METRLNTFAVINGINSLVAFAVLFVLTLRKSHKPIHIAYGSWTIFLFLWSFTYFAWGIQSDKNRALFWLHLCVFAICFLHSTFYWCCMIISGYARSNRLMIGLSFASSVILATLCTQSVFFDLTSIRPIAGFMFWPKASSFLGLLIAVEIFFVLLGSVSLYRASRHASLNNKTLINSFLFSSTIAWIFGWTNWFGFYDWPPMLPYANLGVSFYVIVTAYLIVRRDLLGLELALHRTATYALVTVAVTTAFTLSVLASERLSREHFGYSSLLGTVFASFVITVLIAPLKELLSNRLAVLFYGKELEGLSEENRSLRVSVRSSDQLRSVATLAAGMAHEIKNPLTAIKTFAEHLPAKASDPVFLEKFRRIVGQEVDKIDSIVRQVLEFSRPQANIADTVAVNELLDSTLELLNAQMVRNKIDVERAFDASLPPVTADRKLLQQAFLNILINAIEAMPQGGQLRVETSIDRGEVRITITDTGLGIPSSALPRIFDPFYTNKETGTGLGLAIVKGIIDQHGGKISVRSAKGEGASFEMRLPPRPLSES
ncbi:MAG: Adaptive-response sensory-kinase SasA [Candidatus Omnitrophica bacterium]|nr:Adaptive-response sensory-kinase SasA [Candidatus Omnitrophota bacterium]